MFLNVCLSGVMRWPAEEYNEPFSVDLVTVLTFVVLCHNLDLALKV